MSTQPAPSTASRKHILIVDDARTMREVIKVYLMGNDFRYVTAATASEGLELARHQKPDLVISDVRMPGMTGIELCEHMKSDPELSRVPVVLVSSRTDTAARAAGTRAGAARFLGKPVDADELLALVRDLLL